MGSHNSFLNSVYFQELYENNLLLEEKTSDMIPKIIHYCWFGNKEMPTKEKKCVESWRKHFPNYQIKLWNEENFDLNSSEFCQQAYKMRKYAFVSDYVRTKVLYEYGGVYFDTDFEVVKTMTNLLDEGNNILGFETYSHVGTAIMCFTAKHSVLRRFLEYYSTHSFVDKKGQIDNIANVTILTDILVADGLKCNRTQQMIGDTTIYPREYFYPKRLGENSFQITPATYGIHRCSNSWMTERQRRRGNSFIWRKVMRPLLNDCRSICLKFVGKETVRNIEITIRNILK